MVILWGWVFLMSEVRGRQGGMQDIQIAVVCCRRALQEYLAHKKPHPP